MAWLKEHLALVLSAASVLTVTLKIWAVSHGDPLTISSLVTAESALNLAFAALLIGLPIIGIIAPFVLGTRLMEAIREGEPLTTPIVGAVITVLLAILLAPAGLATAGLIWLAFAVVSSVAIRLTRRHLTKKGRRLPFMMRADPRTNASWQMMMFIVAFICWIAVAVADSPWYPAEKIELKAPEHLIVGYVISERESDLTVLRDSDRQVVSVKTSDVTNRAKCRIGSFTRESLVSLVVWPDRPAYPDC